MHRTTVDGTNSEALGKECVGGVLVSWRIPNVTKA